MKRHHLFTMAGVLALLVLAPTTGVGQEISIGGISVSLGDSNGPTADGSVDAGGGTPTGTASAEGGELAGGSGATTANVTLGGGTTDVGPATGSVTLGDPTTGSPTGSAAVTLGSTTTGSTTGTAGSTPGVGALAVLSESDLRSAVIALAAVDQEKLKRKCAEVLANPAAYDADSIAVCQVVASI